MKHLLFIIALMASTSLVGQMKQAEKTLEEIHRVKGERYMVIYLSLIDSSYHIYWQNEEYKYTTVGWTLYLGDKKEALDFFNACLTVIADDDKDIMMENEYAQLLQFYKNHSVMIFSKKTKANKVLTKKEVKSLINVFEKQPDTVQPTN